MSHKTKQERRDEAAERQAKYDALTPQEKRLHATNPHRPGDRVREIARHVFTKP